MRWLKRMLAALAVLFVVAGATPFLVPASSFIPEIERVASEKLGQPVKLADLELHLLPTPRVVASGIRIGKSAEAQVEALEIVPDLLAFLSGPRAIRLIRAQNVSLKEAALALPGAMPRSASPGEPLRVRRLVLRNVRLEHPAMQLPAFDLDARLGEGFAVEEAVIESRDKAVRVTLEPKDGAATFTMSATQWTLPAGAPFLFDTLAARGVLKGAQVDIADIRAGLYGGTLRGSARADWSKQWRISGKAQLDGVDLAPVQQAMGKTPKLSGRLKASAAFSSQAKAPGLLAAALAADGPFEVFGGAYQGVDLSKAGDITGSVAVGDATTFEELKGTLQLRGKRVRIEALCVRSPKVVAGGQFEVDAQQKLSGRLDVSVAKTGGFVGVPVTLGGTTSDPSIRPSTGYIVGAAVGTLLLPGLGTTLGASAASAFEGKSSCK